ncbi:MogA/MoaB family molybdenum cofactor biosynthesis protein [Rhodocaloribacter sp.]
MSYEAHKRLVREQPVRCAVLTVSDTRTEATDKSGALMQSRLVEAGHEVVAYRILPDEPERITALLDAWTDRAEAILINGGTGISRRDTTYEAVAARLEKTLPGFGELFRMLSFEEIGAGAMLSRAIAGVYRDTLIFSTPGSTGAVRLALDRLILPELNHLVWEIVRQ